MNTYYKFTANVFLAKCTEPHEKGETIPVTTKYGKENDSIVFNLMGHKDGFWYYSIVRADGFNVQEWAKRRAEKLLSASLHAEKKSDDQWKASNKDRDFLVLGEPIKIGHHSEKRHRKMFEDANRHSANAVELANKAADLQSRAEYWELKADTINLSMPESVEYFEYRLERATAEHEGIKNGTIKREHAYSLIYAKKEKNEIEKKLKLARELWGDICLN